MEIKMSFDEAMMLAFDITRETLEELITPIAIHQRISRMDDDTLDEKVKDITTYIYDSIIAIIDANIDDKYEDEYEANIKVLEHQIKVKLAKSIYNDLYNIE